MKFSLDWLGDFLNVDAVGGAAGARAFLDQAGIPIESVARAGHDAILDAEITPNRPDAMGHRGLAREIVAMSGFAPRDLGDRYAEPPSEGEATERLTSIIITTFLRSVDAGEILLASRGRNLRIFRGP